MNDATRRDYVRLTAIATAISVGALVFYYRQGALLLYGDAVAHINIARRVIDSRTPGLFQLGTVWLPLPHLLDIPFVVNDRMWQTGLGGSIPSMIAYVAGVLGIFRLVRGMASRTAGWIGALTFALNLNLIYMQSTAMTESLYLAFFVWSVVYFSEFAREACADAEQAIRSIGKCALMVSAAMLVRYDGWFLAVVTAVAATIVIMLGRAVARPLRRGLIRLVLLTGVTGGLFLAYNHAIYGNALEFANGPWSARAIQSRSRTPSMPSYPGENVPRDAALQFLKVGRLNMAEGAPQYLLFTSAFLALLAAICFSRGYLPWVLLWTPVPFYGICVAWGSVPIYHPEWWPFSYYNVRYGLQLLPAIAVFVALAYEFMAKFFPERAAAAAMGVLIAASCISVWLKTPICLREAHANGDARLALEKALAEKLKRLSSSATLMMDCGAHPGAVEMAGIHFRRVLRESNPPYWEMALTQPGLSAEYVIAFPGDDVARAIRLFPQGLEMVASIGTPSQPKAFLYRSVHP